MRFASRYFKIFRLVLEASADEGRFPDWDTVSRDLSGLLAEESRLPLPPGFGPAERREALWPILVWIDETFLNSRRRDASRWYDRSLQRSLLDTNIGGELFYRRLRALLTLRRRSLSGETEGASLPAARLERELARGGPSGFGGGAGALGSPASPAVPGASGTAGGPGASGNGPGNGLSGTGGSGDEGGDAASDYLPSYFYMEDVPDVRADEVTAPELANLWDRPGDGPEPLESVLDTYAMCIILGFKGQFSLAGRGTASGTGQGAGAGGPDALLDEILGGPAAPGAGRDPETVLPAASEDRELLKAAARRQMRSWSAKGAKPPPKHRKRGFWGRLLDFWKEYNWVAYHILIPLLALGAFYFHGAAIIENLPF
ncbi:MAG: DotU family type IV/VI secretion system protein [Deltaproteobacteria bacterium]|nr:DotU family type IV/VI secretion system protein [Deltaproteobacteria bacterium]